jgi:2,5-diketo-D-gluconate reductase B
LEHQQAAELIFGTWPLTGDAAREATEMALDVGYRRIDTAQWYENEAEVGDALRSAGLRRDDVRITTKVKPDNIGPDRFLPSVRESLDRLGLDRVDLLLIHWPVRDDARFCQTIEALNEARDRGWTTTIGISNATTAQMRRAVEVTNAPVLINQVEFHPLIDQSKVQKVAAELGIALEGYCSLGTRPSAWPIHYPGYCRQAWRIGGADHPELASRSGRFTCHHVDKARQRGGKSCFTRAGVEPR